MRTTKLSHYFAGLTLLAALNILSLTFSAHAQVQNDGQFDPFGQYANDDVDELKQQQAVEGSLHIDQAAQQLFDGPSIAPTPPQSWVSFDQAAQGMDPDLARSIYEGSSEYRVRQELDKPLPKRQPFSDRLGDLQRELNPVDPSGMQKH